MRIPSMHAGSIRTGERIMSATKTWRYYVAACTYKEGKAGGLLGTRRDGQWILHLDRELPLAQGLNYMGGLGYELVGIQPAVLRSGGEIARYYEPDTFYIFKQPIET
jgi:hypothetical protein